MTVQAAETLELELQNYKSHDSVHRRLSSALTSVPEPVKVSYTEDRLRLDILHDSHSILLSILQLNFHVNDLRAQPLSVRRETLMFLPSNISAHVIPFL